MKTLLLTGHKIICLSLILFFSSNIRAASTDHINFRKLSVNEGLSQNTVWGMMQDANNKIWIGTTDGLNRYDGYTFTTYYHTSNDSLSIANNQIISLCTDSDGVSWFGTLVGLSRYNPETDNFTNYLLPNTPFQVLAIEDASDKGILFLATNIGLVSFQKGDKKLHIDPTLKHLTINTICRIKDELLLGTSQGAYLYSIHTKKTKKILPELLDTPIASIIYNTKTKDYWVGTQKKEIYRFNNKWQILKKYQIDKSDTFSPANTVRVLKQCTDGQIWIGTTEALFSFDPEHEIFEKRLSHSSIRSLFIDNQGGIWVGTYYDGINYYHPFAPTFKTLEYSPYFNSLNDKVVSCIVEEPSTKNLWIGTNDGGVNYYNRQKQTFSYYRATKQGNGLRSNNIKAISLDKSGNIYVGTHSGGLSYIHTKTGKIENFSIPQMEAEDNSCYSLLDDGENFHVGSMVGLLLFNKTTKEFRKHPLAESNPELSGILIRALYRDSSGKIWIATEKGLFLYTGTPKVQHLTDNLSSDFSAHIIAYCIHEDSQKNIWVTSANGLYQYGPDIELHKHYTVKNGLINNCIYGLLEDSSRRMWLSTNKGLSCFDIDREQFHNYRQEDGLSHNEFNVYGYCKGSDGTFYFGSLNGITYFSPFKFMENPFMPQPDIVGISLMNQSVTHLQNNISQVHRGEYGRLQGIDFPFNQRQFNIRFTVSNYLSNQRNAFAYQLKGFDKEWNSTEERNVSYSNLPPGHYTFLLKACNNDGKWCEMPTEFFIHITPMWYQTWIARCIFILCGLGIIGWIMYFFIARTRMKMQLQVETLEHNKIQEINNEKVRFYMNMSHELRTPLSLIIAPLEDMMKLSRMLDKKLQRDLQYVYQNSRRLLHIIDQLLNFRKAESGALPIQVEMCNIEEWFRQIFMLFYNQAETRNIDYLFHSGIIGTQFPIDKKYIETILINLLSNAFKFTPDKGKIELELWEKEDTFGFNVKDSGKGIPQEKLNYVFERFYQVNENDKGTGIGLSLVKCLVDKHHGSISVDSKERLYTIFSVTLPKDVNTYTAEELAKQPVKSSDSSLYIDEPLSYIPAEDNQENGMDEDTNKPVILLVDDNIEMLDYLKGILQSKYQVITATNGKIALDIMKTQPVDIVLSDVMMPEMDGLQLCKLVKRNIQTSHIPVILLSAKSSLEDQTSGIDIGADDYIGKPFSTSLLKGKINNILKARERFRQYYSSTINIDTAKMTSNAMDNEFLSKVIQIIEDNISDEKFSTEDLANKLFMSRSNLYIKMNAISGEAPANFIRRIRFNKGCQMLLEGRYTVAEISNKIGFSSPSYFTNSFKKYIGMLPTEYIKKHQEKSNS